MTTSVIIDRWNVWRVVEMPGLSRIDLDGQRATLVFTTSPGCEPAEAEFIASEVARMGYGYGGLPVHAVATTGERP